MPKRAKRLLLCGAVLAACTLIRPAVHLINQLRAQNVSVYTRIHATRHDARHMHGTDLHSQDGQLVPSHLNETRRFPQRLSRSFVHAHASSSGVIAVTWANNALIDFARNWIIRLRNVGVHSYIVGALDKQLYSALAAVNEPVFALYSEIHEPHSRQIGWGTPAFHAMGQQKVCNSFVCHRREQQIHVNELSKYPQSKILDEVTIERFLNFPLLAGGPHPAHRSDECHCID